MDAAFAMHANSMSHPNKLYFIQKTYESLHRGSRQVESSALHLSAQGRLGEHYIPPHCKPFNRLVEPRVASNLHAGSLIATLPLLISPSLPNLLHNPSQAWAHIQRSTRRRGPRKTVETDAAGAPTTWADFCHCLLGHFGLGNSAFKVRDQIQKVIRKAKQNAFVDVNSYYLAIYVHLANLLVESERAYLFYQGLNPRIRALPPIRDSGTPYTLLELAQRAMNLEHQVQHMTHERPPSFNPCRPYQPYRPQEPRASRRPCPSSETSDSPRRGSRRPSNNRPQRNRAADIVC